MLNGNNALWVSFPQALESCAGTWKYVSAYQAPFQELRLNSPQEHTLRACSLLVIPPVPPGQEALPGGVPDDLSLVNLSAWAEVVQDVAAGMLALPLEIHSTLFPSVLELLAHLESDTRVPFCHSCYLPGASCRCLAGAFTTTTPLFSRSPSWSEITEPPPIYGAMASTP